MSEQVAATYSPAAAPPPMRLARRLVKPTLIALYLLWGSVLLLGHVKDHFDALDVTRFVLIGYVGIFLLLLPVLRPLVRRLPLETGVKYIALSLASAVVVEVAHIFSQPFNDGVKVTIGETAPWVAVRNILVDLAVTLPAYAIVFTLVWRRLLSKYRYSFIEFIMLMSIAQFLGDGHVFVIINIGAALLFGPYVFLIYHAMNIPPYVLMRDEIDAARMGVPEKGGRRYAGFWIVPVAYWVYIAVVFAVAIVGVVLWRII